MECQDHILVLLPRFHVAGQCAKKVIFTVCHSGKLKLTLTCPNIISTSCKNFLMSRLISQFFCNLNSSKNFTCPSGKLITEFTSPIAKSTSPRLMNTTFFAHCWVYAVSCWWIERIESSDHYNVSGKLPTYPSPKTTFCLKWEVSVNIGLGEG